ncbi:pilus assembly FimT family protein [Rhodopseudomonas sp. NSM]|uniref:pilus assembly FimT family protein n=1 Tax=Rhodopseudomonas sp. NSM TaxID=3457630 RepID=UPI00403538C0
MSPRRRTEDGGGEAGFTLLEVVCVLAIVALLVAIALPRVPVSTSQPRLQSYAVEIATLLKVDRHAAMLSRGVVSAEVDAPARTVVSGSSRRVVRVPDDVDLEALLPRQCNGRPALSAISFFATGMSCGGAIRLMRPSGGYEIRVNWLTGGIDIVAQAL